MKSSRRSFVYGLLQGGITASVAAVVTTLGLNRAITQAVIANGFLTGLAVSSVTLSIAWWLGFHGRGMGETYASLSVVLVVIAGVAAAVLR